MVKEKNDIYRWLVRKSYPSQKFRYSHAMRVLGASLLLFYQAGPAHALSGAVVTTGQVGLFANGSTVIPNVNDYDKLYCDLNFYSSNQPACSQNTQSIAYQVPPTVSLGLESDTTVSFTSSGSVTTYTQADGYRASLICQTAGDATGLQHCLKVTADGTYSSPSGSCTATFSVTNDSSQCAADLSHLQLTYGASARFDWSSDNRLDLSGTQKIHVNICSNSTVACADTDINTISVESDVYQIQQFGTAIANTPCLKIINGTLVNWPYC